MTGFVAQIVKRRAPGIANAHRAIHNRRMFRRRFRQLHDRIQARIYKRREIEVVSGPFRGMKYFNEIVWGPITPKWLASYEVELHPVIDKIIAAQPKIVIDIACAKGYYAVGLALRLPEANVFAYDTDLISRRQTRRLASIKQVADRVSIGGYCTAEEIRRRVTGSAVLVCDIEGFERALLDRVSGPALRSFDILVEVHEGGGTAPLRDLLRDRFAESHDIRDAWMASAAAEALTSLPREELRAAFNEHRTEHLHWLWMRHWNAPADRSEMPRNLSSPNPR